MALASNSLHFLLLRFIDKDVCAVIVDHFLPDVVHLLVCMEQGHYNARPGIDDLDVH